MKSKDYIIITEQKARKLFDWYRNSSIGHRNFVWVFIGAFCGYVYGKLEYNKKKKGKGIYGDLIYIDEYIVDHKNINSFERNYNKLNIHSFKSKGYECTKLFKALNWEYSPFSYLQLRLWNDKVSYEQYIKNKNITNLLENLKKNCKYYSTDEYQTVVDDSVVRIIQ
ncbi:conserved protein, unknown function [Hepatocystis sp. ex Piliocolobus tephrosceles]|nr:conserved protein, unknown function [Hepatocystis sp. ex Piliocolobus tephrosceles]